MRDPLKSKDWKAKVLRKFLGARKPKRPNFNSQTGLKCMPQRQKNIFLKKLHSMKIVPIRICVCLHSLMFFLTSHAVFFI